MNTYFTSAKTYDDAKAMFRKYCLELHPDTGGNKESFIAMYQEYEKLLKSGHFHCSKEETEKEETFTSYYSDILGRVITLADIHIEIIGTWIWISGNTFEKREYLKGLGFMFSGSKKSWFFNGSNKKHRTFKNYSLNDLRNKWGFTNIDNKETAAVA